MGTPPADSQADFSHADSIVKGHFVEPHQNIIPFTEMLTWLSSRKGGERKGPVRYVQSQNGNLSGEFEWLRVDISELEWANECIGIRIRDCTHTSLGEKPDASNIWIGNEESTTSLHLGRSLMNHRSSRSLRESILPDCRVENILPDSSNRVHLSRRYESQSVL